MSNIIIVCEDGNSTSVKVLDRMGNDLCQEASITSIDITIRPNTLCRATIVYDNVALNLLTQTESLDKLIQKQSNYYPTVKEYE